MRNKIQKTMKEHEEKVDFMNSKISNLLKEVASLSKSQNKKKSGNSVAGLGAAALLATENSNSGSGTDSPGLA